MICPRFWSRTLTTRFGGMIDFIRVGFVSVCLRFALPESFEPNANRKHTDTKPTRMDRNFKSQLPHERRNVFVVREFCS